MGRPKIDIIVEPSITYLLKKEMSYRNIQRELKGHENDILTNNPSSKVLDM